MKKIIFFLLLVQFVQSQNKPPYLIYDENGKLASYDKLIKAANDVEVVLFGEYHDNSIVHDLQLQFTTDLAKKKRLILGAEMFEADNQKPLEQYIKGEIDQNKLNTLARLWPNYITDYKPLVDLAKENKFRFIATNIPRKFASLVAKKGFEVLDTLSLEQKSFIAPLPISYDPNLPGYVAMMKMMGEHASVNMPKAQAIKDATMAYFISKNLADNSVFVHYHGTYHSDNFEGIYWYLKQQKPDLKVLTIATVTQKNSAVFDQDQLHKATFILVVDETVTKTQ